MKIRTKLALILVFISALPVMAAIIVYIINVEKNYENILKNQVAFIKLAIKNKFEGTVKQISEELLKISKKDEISYLISDLKMKEFYGSQEKERKIFLFSKGVVKTSGLKIFKIIDVKQHGKVIALGHRTGVERDQIQFNRIAEEKPGKVCFKEEYVEKKDKLIKVLVLETALKVEDRIVLVGGRVVNKDFLTEITSDLFIPVKIKLFYKKIPSALKKNEKSFSINEFVLQYKRCSNGFEDVYLVAQVSTKFITDSINFLIKVGFFILFSGIILSIIISGFISKRISKPVEELVTIHKKIAAGEREISFEIKRKDEIGDLFRSVLKMASDLQDYEQKLLQAERVAAWRNIARQIAHEIKNPLFPIQASVENIKKAYEKKHPEFESILMESVTLILEEVKRIKNILEEFSKFAKLPSPKFQKCDVFSVIKNTVFLYQQGTEKIDFEVKNMAEVTEVLGDFEQLTMVFSNLIKNSIEAIQDKGKIIIFLSNKNEKLIIEISDTGSGIDDSLRDKIFNPYFTTKDSGTGLGLAIVKRVILEHKGKIFVTEKNGMTTFQIELPLINKNHNFS